MASKIGSMSIIRDKKVKEKLLKARDVHEVSAVAREYIDKRNEENKVVSGSHPFPDYAMSKLLLNVYTDVLGETKPVVSKGIKVYSWCPAWIKTRMGGEQATDTVDKAVERFVQMLDMGGEHFQKDIQGKFWTEGRFTTVRTNKPIVRTQ